MQPSQISETLGQKLSGKDTCYVLVYESARGNLPAARVRIEIVSEKERTPYSLFNLGQRALRLSFFEKVRQQEEEL